MAILRVIWDFFIQNPDWFVFAIIVLALDILTTLYYPKLRGFWGEFWIRQELKKLNSQKYKVLNDVMIIDERGSHQIDHIIVSSFGIFVIEMKSYYGLITGREKDSKWCQHLGKNKSYFMNPIHQNYGHIKALSRLLELEESSFVSIVCFSNQARLRVDAITTVTQTDYICKYILNAQPVAQNLDVNAITSKILSSNVIDKNARINHVTQIQNKQVAQSQLESQMVCPKCGSKLVERSGKYGKFIGCTGYPKCRFVKKI